MSDIAKILGQRIRNHRTAKGLSQERLAELSGCHPTYIGQIERGEKNATIESIGSRTHKVLKYVSPHIHRRNFLKYLCRRPTKL